MKARVVWTTALTKSHKIGVRRASGDDGQKRDHLCNNAVTGASTCINGSGWGGLGLRDVGGDGEELNEEIHWCDDVVCGLADAMKRFLMLRSERLIHALLLYLASLSELGTCTVGS